MAVVRYLVNDVDESVAFYTKNLGFKLQRQGGADMAVLSRDDLTLLIAGPPDSAAKPLPDGRQPGPGGWSRIVVEANDLPTRVAALKKQGVTFLGDVVQGRRGRHILCEDPSGNVVELLQRG